MSTLHPASLQHTDRDIKYRGEGGAGRSGGVEGAGGPPRFSAGPWPAAAQRLCAGCCRQTDEKPPPPRGACSGGRGRHAPVQTLCRTQGSATPGSLCWKTVCLRCRGSLRGGQAERGSQRGGRASARPHPGLQQRSFGTGLVFLKKERNSDFSRYSGVQSCSLYCVRCVHRAATGSG